jgi:hypothetical protein
MTAVTGNTFPVKDAIKALGGRWNPDTKSWMVPDAKAEEARKLVAGAGTSVQRMRTVTTYRPSRCKECGCAPSQYRPIYRSGVCKDCWLSEKEEREMGY